MAIHGNSIRSLPDCAQRAAMRFDRLMKNHLTDCGNVPDGETGPGHFSYVSKPGCAGSAVGVTENADPAGEEMYKLQKWTGTIPVRVYNVSVIKI